MEVWDVRNAFTQWQAANPDRVKTPGVTQDV